MSWSKIDWCDYSLNILTGCLNGCPYCYAKTMSQRFCGNVRHNLAEVWKYRKDRGIYILDKPFLDENGKQIMYPFGFEPTYHRYRFGEMNKLKMGQKVFVGAMTDLFGEWVPDYIVKAIFQECRLHPKNTYMFLTKNPKRYADFELPDGDHFFYGTTITGPNEMDRMYDLPADRKTFISFEPLLDDLHSDGMLRTDIDWIIVGAETGRRKNKVAPDPEWVKYVETYADAIGAPVFMKGSLEDIVGEDAMRQEFPEEMQEKPLSDKITAKRTGICHICGKTFRKKDMVTILAQSKLRGRASTLCYICDDCFRKWCRDSNFNIPDWEDPEDEKEELPENGGGNRDT